MDKYLFILPAYKAKYFRESLKSIQNQTFQNFRVIISDDCSPEDLKSICAPFLEDERFEYRRNKENIGQKEGLVAHWNMLLENYDAEYVIMASDDDIYEPKFLEEIDELVEKYPEVNLFRARAQKIRKGEIIFMDDIYEEKGSKIYFMKEMFYLFHTHCIGNYVFKKSYFDKVGRFVNFPAAWYSDNVAALMCAENGIVNTKDILFNSRISEENISSESKNRNKVYDKQKIEASVQFISWMQDFCSKIKAENKYEEFILDKMKYKSLKYAYKNTLPYVRTLSVKEFIRFYNFFNRQNLLEENLYKLQFIKQWMK